MKIRKMQTAAGGSFVIPDNGQKLYEDFSKLPFKDKIRRRLNIAKTLFNQSSSPVYNSIKAIFGGYDPENPNLIIGEPSMLPSRGVNPKQVLLAEKLMETINKYWKNIGKSKIRLEGNGKYLSGILTLPGTAPTTFNGLNIRYIESPKGLPVTHKFYTELGSEYILTKDGFARRVKSPHSNTGGSDVGLHNWNSGHTLFTEGIEGDLFNMAGNFLRERGKDITIGNTNGKLQMWIRDNSGLWRKALKSDAFPLAIKEGIMKDGEIISSYSKEPIIGNHILEYDLNNLGIISGYHAGSPVVFIEGMKQGGILKALLGNIVPLLSYYDTIINDSSITNSHLNWVERYKNWIFELNKLKAQLEAEEAKLRALKTDLLGGHISLISNLLINKFANKALNKNGTPASTYYNTSFDSPDSSNLVYTTNSGISNTVDEWRNLILR